LGAEPFETASNDQKPIREDQFETNETFALVSYLQEGIIIMFFSRIEKRIGFSFKILKFPNCEIQLITKRKNLNENNVAYNKMKNEDPTKPISTQYK